MLDGASLYPSPAFKPCNIATLEKEVEIELHILQFCILQDQKSNSFWLIVFLFFMDKLHLKELINNITKTFKRFVIDGSMCVASLINYVTECRLQSIFW